MTERRRIIEGTWTCSSCDTQGIPGRQKTCPTCGNPREGEEASFDFGARTDSGASTAATVDDAQALELAAAGEDWYCGACGTANKGSDALCRSCGGDEHLAKPPPKQAPPAEPPPPPKRRGLSVGCLVVLGVIGCSGVLCCGLTTWKRDVQGSVTALSWQRTVHVEDFADTTAQGWRGELSERTPVPPKDGAGGTPGVQNVRDCVQKQKDTRKVAVGTETKCETVNKRVQCGTDTKCEVKDLGNGFAEEVCKDVPRYCDEPTQECKEVTRYVDEPIMDLWCTYDTQQWRRVDSKTASGSTDAPTWPSVSPAARQRLVKEEAYSVTVTYGSDTFVLEPDAAGFSSWHLGDPALVEVNGLGKPTGVKQAEAP